MPRMIFVNLPVTELSRSIPFYEAVGATKDNRFCDDSAAMLSFSESIHVMLLTQERFASFTTRKIIDAHQSAQTLIALSAENRAEVDAIIGKAVAAGAEGDPNPVQEHGFMYGRSFADPDGHIWEVVWMDVEAAMQAGNAAEAAA
jgi:predicted lactoylglutathione lyase